MDYASMIRTALEATSWMMTRNDHERELRRTAFQVVLTDACRRAASHDQSPVTAGQPVIRSPDVIDHRAFRPGVVSRHDRP